MNFIDTHVHLFASCHLSSLAWMTEDHKLSGNHDFNQLLGDYPTEITPTGFVFIEADRKSSLDRNSNPGWKNSIEEYSFVCRIVSGTLAEGEGINGSAKLRSLIKGAIPWAPVPAGPKALEEYHRILHDVDSNHFDLIKGYRYLLQDKPKGTMTAAKFIHGVRWLGQNDLVFELGINVHSGGLWQLQEAVEMVNSTPDVTFIIDHMTKPDFTISSTEIASTPLFLEWKYLMGRLSNCSSYVKISGVFNEFPPNWVSNLNSPEKFQETADRITVWLKVILSLWGPDRLIYGSDWPVCTIEGGKGSEGGNFWWYKLVNLIFDELQISQQDRFRIFYSNSIKAYRLNI